MASVTPAPPSRSRPDPNHENGLPLYLQVESNLRTAILRGVYPVGSRLPTEEALCDQYKVSRHTIREALRKLRDARLITSQPGMRPRVASQVPRPPEAIAGDIGVDFFDYTIGTRLDIQAMETIAVTPAIAAQTGLVPGEDCLYIQCYRVDLADGHLTCWNEFYIRGEFALVGRLLHRHVGPLIPLIEDLFEERISRIKRDICAVPMPAEQGNRLGAQEADPAMQITVTCETEDGKIAMVNRSLHAAGTISYTIRRY